MTTIRSSSSHSRPCASARSTSTAVLRSLVETTLRAIFPGRKIARFAEGYEASLLVLRGDPLRSFDLLSRPRLRMKQGVVVGQ